MCHKNERSPKQIWNHERCFQNYGSLYRLEALLAQVAGCRSTLPGERQALLRAAYIVCNVKNTWINKPWKDRSWELYRRR